MPVLSSRPPRQTEKAAKCPEPLCPTRVLPPLGRRDPSPERTLLLRLRSYRLIRRSRWALSSFGFWPRLESPCSLLPVPAAHGSFPTLSPTVCSWMLDPLPRRYTVCSRLFLPRCHRPSPLEKWVGFPQLSRLKRLRAGEGFEVADISLCSGLQVCLPPRSSLPLRKLPQGSRGFYVRAKRGSLPPRASDMLTARRQAIGGAGTCTPLDCGLVGCSFPAPSTSQRSMRISRTARPHLLHVEAYGTYHAGATFGPSRRTRRLRCGQSRPTT